MRILWLAPEPPVPPLTGGRERARRMLEYLAQEHEIYLVTFAAPEDAEGLDDLGRCTAGLRALPYPPRPRRTSAAMRSAVQCAQEEFVPQVIHVQGLEMWPYASKGKWRVLDLHDAPSILLGRLQALENGLPGLATWRHWWRLSRLRSRERQAISAADAVIVTSQVDREALQQRHGDVSRFVVLPNGLDLASWPFENADSGSCTGLFPGALNWAPNVDAARVLIQDLLPLVQARLPAVKVVIAGRQPDPALLDLAQANPAVVLIANPEDMQAIFAQATVVAVPLRAATGTRVKILQALATGRAVASTPAGAEGLELENGVHLCISPLVRPFAEALVELLGNPERRLQLRRAGRIAAERYEWYRYLPVLDVLYGRLAERTGIGTQAA